MVLLYIQDTPSKLAHEEQSLFSFTYKTLLANCCSWRITMVLLYIQDTQNKLLLTKNRHGSPLHTRHFQQTVAHEEQPLFSFAYRTLLENCCSWWMTMILLYIQDTPSKLLLMTNSMALLYIPDTPCNMSLMKNSHGFPLHTRHS